MSKQQTISLSEFAAAITSLRGVALSVDVSTEQFERLVREAKGIATYPNAYQMAEGTAQVAGVLVRDAGHDGRQLAARIEVMAKSDNDLLRGIPFKPVR